MKLSREQRARLLAGDYSPLVFEIKPFGCEPGAEYVLNWQSEIRTHDGKGNVAIAPRMPLRWLTVRKVTRHVARGWIVRFEITDRRHPTRLPRRTPPHFDAERFNQDQERGPTEDEIAEAREESSYTSDPRAASDHLDGVDDETLSRYATENWIRDDERETERREAWEALNTVERLRGELLEAERLGTDHAVQLAAIERRIAAIRRKNELTRGRSVRKAA